ncbi:YggS family pyridoxal phosphate-dependent enzyme [Aliiroseovarius marinus]|uniref:YggS family pyridoxal phosphate-dependent enzyme n=1 Tax=Aliiroseovarius marinus TaxID=2500159 RepID=UPI003D7DF90C
MALSDIQDHIAKEEARMGRAPGSTQLIAVSKVQPLDRVVAVLDEGHRVFGENKVQEAAGKWPDLKEKFDGIELHLIGPLQTNKTRQAMGLFDVIQTVDRPKLVRAIARIAQEEGSCPRLFIQVNTGEEPQKAGVLPEGLGELVELCDELKLPIEGLMCIPPSDEEPSLHFALLAKLAKRHDLSGLSMGMSSDFERAVAQGASYVRVGSAIFGARDYG